MDQRTNVWNSFFSRTQGRGVMMMGNTIMKQVLKEISFNGKTVVELGCGTGIISYLARENGAARITLVDSSMEALEIARNLFKGASNVEFVLSDLFSFNTCDMFDIALSSGLVEHFEGGKRVECVEIHKDLARGKVVIVAPFATRKNRERMKEKRTMEKYGWQRPFTKEEMEEIFTQVGLKMTINRRFYTPYGREWERPFRKIGTILTKPTSAYWGGLLLSVGEI